MNSTFLRLLAVILAIGAITTAWIGYRISTKPPADAVKVVTPSYSHVVAAQDIPPGKLLTVDDVELASSTQLHPHAYRNIHDVLGKMSQAPLIAGEILLPQHLPAPGALAQSLGPGERAVAVKVNEVIGVGGFVKPGDHVDVLLYLRAERETDNVSSAQVVLKDIKVLAYGEALVENTETSPPAGNSDESNSLRNSAGNKKTKAKKEKDSRSAILAVPEQQVSRLMLAESSGILRLALRGVQPPGAGTDGANQFVRLDEVARPVASTQTAAMPDSGTASRTTTAPVRKTTAAAKRERVIIHKGEQMEVVTVAR